MIIIWEHENAAEKEMLMQEEALTEEQAEERARENVFYVAATFTEILDNLHDYDETGNIVETWEISEEDPDYTVVRDKIPEYKSRYKLKQ